VTKPRSRFLIFVFEVFFDAHVFEFTGLEYFAAFEALHELGIFFAAYDLHARMLARLLGALRVRERL
jgi:hypothetical protein